MARVVRAAGGVVWRRTRSGDRAGDPGAIEVLLVHRPRQDDWTIPKGKCEPIDADELATALREVHEETGHRCRASDELPSARYHDAQGRPKVVRYWVMESLGDDGFHPNAEVDERRWVRIDDAAHIVSYPSERDVLSAFVARLR